MISLLIRAGTRRDVRLPRELVILRFMLLIRIKWVEVRPMSKEELALAVLRITAYLSFCAL